MRLARIRLSIRFLMAGIAIGTLFAFYVVLPTWNYYRLDPITRQITAQLRKPVRLSLIEGRKLRFDEFLREVRILSADADQKSIPIYVDPIGLQDVNHTLATFVEVERDQVPIAEHLRRALGPLGMDYSVRDGLLTVTSAGSVDR